MSQRKLPCNGWHGGLGTQTFVLLSSGASSSKTWAAASTEQFTDHTRKQMIKKAPSPAGWLNTYTAAMNAVNFFRAQLYLTPCRVTIPGKNIKRRKLSAARTSSAASARDEAREPSCMLMLDPRLRWSIRFPGWQRHGCFAVLLLGWLIGADRQPLWAAWPSYHWEYAFFIHSWGYLSRSRCATFHCRKVPSLNQIWGKIPLSSMTMMYTGRIKCLISVNAYCLRCLCSFLLPYELILIFSL